MSSWQRFYLGAERFRPIAYIGPGGAVARQHHVGSIEFFKIWDACPENHRYIVMEDCARRVLVTDLHTAKTDEHNNIDMGEYEVFVDADQAIAATALRYSLVPDERIENKALRLRRAMVRSYDLENWSP